MIKLNLTEKTFMCYNKCPINNNKENPKEDSSGKVKN